ncbi:hypothetical protein HPB52_024679 [Rhipicephalus sanguineus]|uniref:Uncharacterized protein n=1 Tax=Rhipicephalus sanguineus TaxID=34632 RepID=A0A9D4YS71_RHISA|nr:hypothetical protein HPB52_024679 [Rhipicephalus sanguineus]
MFHKAYKAAVKLPQGTPTSKPRALGLHSTYAELSEAQITTRLTETQQAAPGSYDSALSTSFTKQLPASPLPTTFVPLIRTPSSPAISIYDYIRAGGKPECKTTNENTGTITLRTMLSPPTTISRTLMQ